MRSNLGSWQRAARGTLGLTALAGAALAPPPEPWTSALLVAGLTLLITAITGWCPLFSILGLSPPRSEDDSSPPRD